jgi:hypothetical protein
MKNNTMTNLALAIAVVFLATGCSTTLQHGKIYTTPTADKGPMGVDEHAQNITHRIGWGTFTVFAIPIAPVTINGEADTALMTQIKDAVAQAGYQVKMVDSNSPAGSMPVLHCRVLGFGFRNYTWFLPFVFNWGNIELKVSITATNGDMLWNKTYTGKANGFYDFDPTVNKALTTILNELSSDLLNADLKNPTNMALRATKPEVLEQCDVLESSNPDKVVHALKVLRTMNAPEAVPYILPCLTRSNEHIIRDACRTLAVLGNKDVIPYIEPLLKHSRSDVRKDAQDAIAALRAKP